MRKQEPTTRTIKASEARQQFSEVINEVFRGETRVVIERSGIPVAAIISKDDLDRLNEWEAWREERFKALDASREAFKDVSDRELEQEIKKAIASARREHKRQQKASA